MEFFPFIASGHISLATHSQMYVTYCRLNNACCKQLDKVHVNATIAHNVET